VVSYAPPHTLQVVIAIEYSVGEYSI